MDKAYTHTPTGWTAKIRGFIPTGDLPTTNLLWDLFFILLLLYKTLLYFYYAKDVFLSLTLSFVIKIKKYDNQWIFPPIKFHSIRYGCLFVFPYSTSLLSIYLLPTYKYSQRNSKFSVYYKLVVLKKFF